MTNADVCKLVPGAASFVEWFGRWPEFHDSEVLSCTLRRNGETSIVVHTFNMTQQIDERGYYINDKHALITFVLGEIEGLQLLHFNTQNALLGLRLIYIDEMFTLSFDPAHGLEGSISSKHLHIEWIRGKPEEGVYA